MSPGIQNVCKSDNASIIALARVRQRPWVRVLLRLPHLEIVTQRKLPTCLGPMRIFFTYISYSSQNFLTNLSKYRLFSCVRFSHFSTCNTIILCFNQLMSKCDNCVTCNMLPISTFLRDNQRTLLQRACMASVMTDTEF